MGTSSYLTTLLKVSCIQANTFRLCGMGYVSSRLEKSYKIVGFTYDLILNHLRFAMFEFETNAWKFIDQTHYDAMATIYIDQSLHNNNVSLHGNLYWTAYNLQTGQYFVQILDFSKEIVKPFCILPCKKKVPSNTLVLAVYKKDRFSLLEQCMRTRNIEIWVTKKKISNGDDGDIVVWVKFMTVSRPNFPRFDHWSSSYLVDNNIYGKSFVMCCSEEETEKACVFIVREDLCKKIKIDYVFGPILCSVCVPSLILIS